MPRRVPPALSRTRHPDLVMVRRAAARMGLLAALSAVAIVAVLTAVTVFVLFRNQQAAAATLLADTVQRADDVVDAPSGMWLVMRVGAVISVSPGLPPGLPVLEALDQVQRTGTVDIRDVTVNGTHFRVRTEARRGAVVQAGLDLGSDRLQTISVLRALLLIGGMGLALALLAGTWVGHWTVRPLAAALALQRNFVADASHELRTPVTLLSTRAQLIRRKLRGTPDLITIRTEVDGLVSDASQLSAILEDLLLIADQHDETPVTVDLVELIHQVASAAAPHARAQAVEVTAAQGPPAPILGSPVALRRALTALIDNAIQHARTSVWLSATVADGHVIVEVRDDGPGIDTAIAPRLFDRFASTGSTDAAQRRHYGLGLALVSDIAARHHGTVASVGKAGQNATIRLTLPAAPTRAIQHKPGVSTRTDA
jgi:two-component system OmpR family sensor kinase